MPEVTSVGDLAATPRGVAHTGRALSPAPASGRPGRRRSRRSAALLLVALAPACRGADAREGGHRRPALQAAMPATGHEVGADGVPNAQPPCPIACAQPGALCPAKDPPSQPTPAASLPALVRQRVEVASDLRQAIFDELAGRDGPLWVVLASDDPRVCAAVQHRAPADTVLARAAVQVVAAGGSGEPVELWGPRSSAAGAPASKRAREAAAGRTPKPSLAVPMARAVALRAGATASSAHTTARRLAAQPCPGLAAYLRDWAARPGASLP